MPAHIRRSAPPHRPAFPYMYRASTPVVLVRLSPHALTSCSHLMLSQDACQCSSRRCRAAASAPVLPVLLRQRWGRLHSRRTCPAARPGGPRLRCSPSLASTPPPVPSQLRRLGALYPQPRPLPAAPCCHHQRSPSRCSTRPAATTAAPILGGRRRQRLPASFALGACSRASAAAQWGPPSRSAGCRCWAGGSNDGPHARATTPHKPSQQPPPLRCAALPLAPCPAVPPASASPTFPSSWRAWRWAQECLLVWERACGRCGASRGRG